MKLKSFSLGLAALILFSGSAMASGAMSPPFSDALSPSKAKDVGRYEVTPTGSDISESLADIVPVNEFKVAAYGALGVSLNDCPAIQSAIDAAQTSPNGKVLFDGSKTYKCASGIVWDAYLSSVDMNGATIDATSMTTGSLVTVQSTTGGNIYKRVNRFSNGDFVGPGKTSSVDLFTFNTTDSSTSSRSYIENISAKLFRTAEVYQNRAYLITVNNANYEGMGKCYHMQDGFNDYGENIVHSGGMCAQTIIAAQNDESSFSNTMNFFGTSFDFNEKNMYVTKGEIVCSVCHFETTTTAATSAMFEVDDSSAASIRLLGGDMFFNGSNLDNDYPTFDADGEGTIVVKDMLMHNMYNTTEYLGTGSGLIDINGTIRYTDPNGNMVITDVSNSKNNRDPDGSFEESSIKNFAWISADAAPITDRFNGNNVDIAIDATQSRTGSQSLKYTKAFGSGSASGFTIAVPIDKASTVIHEIYWKKVGSQTGTVFIAASYSNIIGSDDEGIPVIGQKEEVALYTLNLTSSPVDWTRLRTPGNLKVRAPSWATHYILQLNGNGMNAGDLYFDDFIVSTM